MIPFKNGGYTGSGTNAKRLPVEGSLFDYNAM